jgi:hypothetical protein
MSFPSRSALALFLAFASVTVAVAAPPPQVDALGRVVRDANGKRITYRRTGGEKAVVPVTRAKPVVRGTAPAPAAPDALRKTSPAAPVMMQALAPASYAENWRFLNWSGGVGTGGFYPVDLDANGDQEFVVGTTSSQWGIVDYDAAKHEYRMIWKSPRDGLAAVRLVEFGNTKYVWASRGDSIDVYDALTRSVLTHITLPANVSVFDLAFADGNNDGDPDVVALSLDRIFFYDPVTFALESSIATGAQAFAIGNVDDDPQREIVLNDGRVIVATGSSYSLQYQNPTAFGWRLALGDVDADGRDELFAAQSWQLIQAWDLDVPASKWEHTTSHDIAALRLFDVTGDGVPELLFGDGQWGLIHALNAQTHAELWTVNNPDHSVTDIGVFDADNDGQLELLWGAGATSSGPDYMYVVSVATRAVEFQSYDIASYYTALDVGDVDNDGRAELVVASFESESGYADGVLLIFDAITHDLEYRSGTALFGGIAWEGVQQLRIANVDADPQPEILVATSQTYDGRLHVIDGLTHAVENVWPFGFGEPLSQVAVGDLDGDGLRDAVVANYRAHSGATGDYLQALDPRTGASMWKSQHLNGYIRSVQVADVGSPGLDLVATVGYVLKVRWSDKQQVTSTALDYTSVIPMDVAGNSALELVASRGDGSIDVLDGDTLAVITSRPNVCVGGGFGALVSHGPSSVAFVCNSALAMYDLATSASLGSVDTGLIWAAQNGSLVRFVSQGKSSFFIGGDWPAVFVDLSGNSVPTLPARTANLHWRSSIDLSITGTDPDNDALSYQVVGLPAIGTVAWLNQGAGQLRYTAGGAAKGTDSLLLRAYDGFQYSDPQTVTLTLTNTAPTATTTTLSAHWRGAQTLQLAGADANGDPLTYVLGTAPTRGTLALLNAANGDVRFEPSGAFIGSDTLTFRVSDGVDTSAPQTVQLNLTNATPTAPNPSYSVTIGNTVSGRVAGADANSDPLTYALVTAPSRGTFALDTATGLFDYVPVAGSGNVTAQVVVRDGVSESTPVTVTFTYPAPSSSGGGGKKGGGSLDLLILAGLALGLVARRRRKVA